MQNQVLEKIVYAAALGGIRLAARAYGLRVHGLEQVRGALQQGPVIMGVKHQSNLDLPVMLYVLDSLVRDERGEFMVIATDRIFINGIVSSVLGALKTHPIELDAQRNLKPHRTSRRTIAAAYGLMKRGGVVAYAPEGKRMLNGVAAPRLTLMRRAVENGADPYIVGIEYGNKGRPFFSLLHSPGKSGIDVRIEQLSIGEWQDEEAAKAEVMSVFARLSGLEKTVGTQ